MKPIILVVLGCLYSGYLSACEFAQVKFDANFSGGRLNQCKQVSANHFQLNILPENEPVNPSPWYNFKLSSTAKQQLTLELSFNDNYARYLPKISRDGEHWQGLPFTTQDKNMLLNIEVSNQPLWIAAQEPIDNDVYPDWLKQLADRDIQTERVLLGNSTENRPIHALIRENKHNKEWLVLIGRQHPPEVTGAMALFSFVETLLSNDQLAQQFNQRFNILLVPDLNPDGVAKGNWRHNAKGVDLNRDWATFAQVESRLVRDKLAAITKAGGKIVFAIDFHSTYHDVFYTMPDDYKVYPSSLMTDWLTALNKRTQWIFRPSIKPGSNPDNGVFKQFIADTYQVHAVTYEVGDNTNREEINYVATQAAQELMRQLNNTAEAAFAVPQP